MKKCTPSRREAHCGEERVPGERQSLQIAEIYKQLQEHWCLKLWAPSIREGNVGRFGVSGPCWHRPLAGVLHGGGDRKFDNYKSYGVSSSASPRGSFARPSSSGLTMLCGAGVAQGRISRGRRAAKGVHRAASSRQDFIDTKGCTNSFRCFRARQRGVSGCGLFDFGPTRPRSGADAASRAHGRCLCASRR